MTSIYWSENVDVVNGGLIDKFMNVIEFGL